MRTPQDFPRRLPRTTRRTRILIVAGLVVLVVLIASLRALAQFWTDYLWFQSVHFTSVFKGVLLTKVILSVVFIAIFFLLLLVSLTVADRLSPEDVDPGAANELVVRYRMFAGGRAVWIRVVTAAVFAVLGGIGADRQWNNWDLFRYRVSFGVSDPQFHRDVGFYVFELPFIRFLIAWSFDAVLVTLIVTAVFHYLNGGIVPQAAGQRVLPPVKAHISVLLGVLALIKAVGYYYDRLGLVLSRNHIVDGATATSVHADLPAKFLLIVIAIASAIMFLANVRLRGWVLPVTGVASWALVSVLVGAAYPAIYQAVYVHPSQQTREAPYIARNIAATRAAYGLDKVKTPKNYTYSPTLTQAEIQNGSAQAQVNQQTLANVRLLDPAVNIQNTFIKYQGLRQYYTFNNLYLDRYPLDLTGSGTVQETAAVTAVRELNDQVPTDFVNRHLVYTHGYGAVQAPVSEYGVNGDGYPNFTLSDIPPQSSQPATQLDGTTGSQVTGPDVYYGLGPDTNGYVIADSKTAELDYQDPKTLAQVTSHYNGNGGVPAGSILRRAAFALRFGDLNFILSGQITPSSKVLFYRNVVQEVQKAAPFLRFDSDPYAVILNGSIYWVVDAYTITNNYPYSQAANLNGLPANSGLNTAFNYVRNSVKVVVSAYTGQMTFFDMGTQDPILKVYERAFPDLFKPRSQADQLFPGITAHWRYPEDIFQVQTNMFGRYHVTDVDTFYNQGQSWTVSPDPGSGLLNSTSAIGSVVANSTNPNQVQYQPLQPQYIEAAQPGTGKQGVDFMLITPFVPQSETGTSQNLTAFMTASSDPSDYGDLTLYQVPPGTTVDGPGLIANAIRSNPNISKELTLFNTQGGGTQVELGEVDVVPLDQTLLYIDEIYVESVKANIPTLDDVVVVYNGKAYDSGNAGLDNALCQVVNPDGTRPFSNYCNTSFANEAANNPLGANPTTPSTPSTTTTTQAPTGTVPAGTTEQSLVAAANQDLINAQAALRAGNLAQYQADVNAAQAALQQAQAMATATPTTTTPPASSPTTTTTSPATTSPPTTVAPGSPSTSSVPPGFG